ncbi:hypothetical protein [Clostridium sp.]|uniref:hypothetical protein n=1 Tax=Clostridium sp. TaxID=1506 RepID=UPI003520A272
MSNNKTMVIYTLENGKYHAYITGMDLYVSDYKTLEECEVSVAEEFKEMLEPCTVEQTANQLKRYFEDGDNDIQSITDIVKIDIMEC